MYLCVMRRLYFLFYFFSFGHIELPNQGLSLCHLQWKGRVWTTGPPGNPLHWGVSKKVIEMGFLPPPLYTDTWNKGKFGQNRYNSGFLRFWISSSEKQWSQKDREHMRWALQTRQFTAWREFPGCGQGGGWGGAQLTSNWGGGLGGQGRRNS